MVGGHVKTNDTIDQAWIEISSRLANGETTIRWYVEYCSAANRCVVADRRTEDEAISAAMGWELPIVHSRHSAGDENREGHVAQL